MSISNNASGYRPGVCTFDTRPTAPYEGQMIYTTDLDTLEIWNGSSWTVIGGSTAVGNSGLVYVKSQALSGTTTSITSCFSSTYDNYRIELSNLAWNGGAGLWWNLLNGTTIINTNFYGWAYNGLSVGGANLNDLGAANSNSGFLGASNNGANNLIVGSVAMDIIGPNLAQRTVAHVQAIGHESTFFHRTGMTVFNATDQADGIRIWTSSGQTVTGTATIYGYRKQ